MRWGRLSIGVALLLPVLVWAAPRTPEDMDTICWVCADVVKGMAVQRDKGKSVAQVTPMVRDLLKGQNLDWRFPLFDEVAVEIYGCWARLSLEQGRTAWHQWCRRTALTPET
jgi:hypothetical protein